MDQFRLQALAKLLRSQTLTTSQTQQASQQFIEKLTIFCNGARKRDRHDTVDTLQSEYRDLIDPALIL